MPAAVSVWLPLLLLNGGSGDAAESPPFHLRNPFLAVGVRDGAIESLQCDPMGAGNYAPSFITRIAFDGVGPATGEPDVKLEDDGKGIVWRGLSACVARSISITQVDRPDMLSAGHTLGQSFSVPRRFEHVTVKLPTWHTSDASATLELLKGDRVIATRRIEAIPDNSLQTLAFEPQPPGEYLVRLRDPEGTVGWWSSSVRRYQGGSAYADGAPDPGSERYLEVPYQDCYGEAEVRITVQDARLEYELSGISGDPAANHAHALLWSVPWERDGYDTSPRATPFKRFYSDTQRFMPVEQLKRTEDPELTLQGSKWIHIDGTGRCDYVLRCTSPSVSWRSGPRDMTIRVNAAAGTDSKDPRRRRQSASIELLPREDDFPDDWPVFTTSDPDLDRDLNLMFYERNFTYPAPCGPAPWVEWSAIARGWFAGPMRDGERSGVEGLVIDGSGYVHTWGGEPGWPFPDPKTYDTRHFDTNARYILAAWRYAIWTQDTDFIRGQADRLRRAMSYQLEALGGKQGLIVTASKDVTGRHQGVGNNYWDILPFGHLDAYANIVFFASLEAMAEIEELLAGIGTSRADASIPVRSPTFYRGLRRKCREKYTATFWDEAEGRFIGCIDLDGERHDYGFVFLNLEAMAYGLASSEQAERIYEWLEHGTSSTGEADIYTQWVFAPRATTIHNPMWNPEHPEGIEDGNSQPWWHFGWHGTPFGDQCQDGGAIFYTSFFDLMARTRFLGAERAYGRWREILARYREPDRLCGGKPLFRGEIPQQVFPGSVGLDLPFPESGLVPCWFVYGVMGIEPTVQGLRIAPRLPTDLDFCSVRNLSYRGLGLSVRVTRTNVRITSGQPGAEFDETFPLDDSGEFILTRPPVETGEYPRFGPWADP